mmetsp:Transcript_37353/g.92366  ORF Transcript_37353/g.92366 Transcript_37353/m.92366 type:complete len:451 (+) Transcript_37353:605-1957(+)
MMRVRPRAAHRLGTGTAHAPPGRQLQPQHRAVVLLVAAQAVVHAVVGRGELRRRQHRGLLRLGVDVAGQPQGSQYVDDEHAERRREDDGKHGGGEDVVAPLLPLVEVRVLRLVLHDVLQGVARQRRLHRGLGNPRQGDEQLLLEVHLAEGAREERHGETDGEPDAQQQDGARDGLGRQGLELDGGPDHAEQQRLEHHLPRHGQLALHLMREAAVGAGGEAALALDSPRRPPAGPHLVGHDAQHEPAHGPAAAKVDVLAGEHDQQPQQEDHGAALGRRVPQRSHAGQGPGERARQEAREHVHGAVHDGPRQAAVARGQREGLADGVAGDGHDVVEGGGGHHQRRDALEDAVAARLQVEHAQHHHGGGHGAEDEAQGEPQREAHLEQDGGKEAAGYGLGQPRHDGEARRHPPDLLKRLKVQLQPAAHEDHAEAGAADGAAPLLGEVFNQLAR